MSLMNIKAIISFMKGTSKRRKITEDPDLKVRNKQMTKKTSPPSIKKTAFDCPHCGAFTTQYWFHIFAKQLKDDRPSPFVPDKEWKAAIQQNQDISNEDKIPLLDWCDKFFTGLVFLENKDEWGNKVNNLYISKCYHCKKMSVWVHDNIVFPYEKQGIPSNQDLPDEIIQDFEEARAIVGLSPRGAAALLRLCIQKLCVFLGEKGKNIDDDIASLVAKGLNPLVQKSLDIVRVIGNEAVHPGLIDLSDDRDTANKLFGLINSIADQMITHPKNVDELYENLPENKRRAIEARNGKVKK